MIINSFISFPTGGGGGFSDPTDISGLMLWLKADAIVGLSDGDPVSTWEDSSTANNDFAQSTALQKPTYQTNELNSLPIVRFDGGNDSLVSGSITGLTDYTVFIVAKDASASNMWVLEMGNTNNSIITNYSNAGQYGHYSPESPIGANSTTLFKIVSTSIGSTATGAWILGASTGGQYYGGDIAEVICYDSDLSGGDITNVTSYLETKYGL